MSNAPTLPQIVAMLTFMAITFVILRTIIAVLAQRSAATLAAPILTLAGVVAAYIVARLNIDNFFIWYLLFIGLVLMNWHSKSRIEDKKLLEMTGPGMAGKSDTERVQAYALTRRLLSFGLVSYMAAFCVAYYFLFTRR
jgi:hypothetical protein